MTMILGIALAAACAVATNLGFLYKHRGARAAAEVDFGRPLWSTRQLFSSRAFTIGMLIACGSWAFHIAAMSLVPLSVVQAVLAGGIVLLAIMAERYYGACVGPRQWSGLGMTAAGLILLGVSLPHVQGAHSHYSLPGMIAFEAGLIALGTLLIAGPRIGAPRHHRGVMLGAASGILFGVSDVAIKALTGEWGEGLLGFIFPWVPVMVAASVVAFFTSARALQDGQAVPVIAITSTAANVSGILGGLVVFGDPFPTSTLGILAQVAAFALVLVAAWFTPAPARAAGFASG
jgi:multidrug transporter EmrE-like cation transporter